jgi:hypothetical protein
MTWNSDVTWADRVAKATLLIRILLGWVFLSEVSRSFCSRIPWAWDVL